LNVPVVVPTWILSACVVPNNLRLVNPFNVLVASTPLIVLLNRFVVDENDEVLLEITLVVALTPFTVVVKTFPDKLVLSELMILVNTLCIPFTRVAKVLVVVESEFEFTKLVVLVEITPLTFEVKVKVLVVVAIVRELEVEEAKSEDNEVVAINPLILVVRSPVLVA
jgi:hypothetical protein